MGYKSLSGVTQSIFWDLRSHHSLVLCCTCFPSFYASLRAHKVLIVLGFLCVSELYFKLKELYIVG
jgi:hypothetical protein